MTKDADYYINLAIEIVAPLVSKLSQSDAEVLRLRIVLAMAVESGRVLIDEQPVGRQ